MRLKREIFKRFIPSTLLLGRSQQSRKSRNFKMASLMRLAKMMVVIYACTVPVFSSNENSGLYTQCKTSSADQNLYKYKSELLNGTAKTMNDYMGQISLVVNVASFWGLTNTTYHFLNALAAKYGGSSQCSLKIIAFPCNQVFIFQLLTLLKSVERYDESDY